jgi:perosamine synthetase
VAAFCNRNEKIRQGNHKKMIPYGKQCIDEDDIRAVVEVLRSDWLTTGPAVEAFERAVAEFVDVRHAVAVSSGTAALHAIMNAIGVAKGDEVIVPAMTFAATANSIVYQGGVPVFVDVGPEDLLIDPQGVQQAITPRTKAIVAVDYAGHPCDYTGLIALANHFGLELVSDGCHSLGAVYQNVNVGKITAMTAFSFHPVKAVTSGEGGMVTTDREDFYQNLLRFRNHGITTDFRQREKKKSWYYEVQELGYNYRLTDIQCALGLSQLKKLPEFLRRRTEIAARYDHAFSGVNPIKPLRVAPDIAHARHLYVIRLDFQSLGLDRKECFERLRQREIGVNVHYLPVHLHPFYKNIFHTHPGMCPEAEKAYEEILSLPLYPGMADAEVDQVIGEILNIVQGK